MNRFTLVFLHLLFFAAAAVAQESAVSVKVVAKENGEPVANARVGVRGTTQTATTDERGVASFAGIGNGRYVIEVTADGFQPVELEVEIAGSPVEATAELEEAELGEVFVSTTRTGREIENTPTRVEAIDGEEIDEKSSMKSNNVAMLLNESTGIKVQQTSAVSYSQSVRIQGLDGRYTQILKDGFPAYGGFSGSVGILDILPLDLKQVEIVKGAASTFYGGGAIAGVINFVSREPEERPVTNAIINVTSAAGADLSVFNTRRSESFGHTLLGSFNIQREYDADGDGFTELPRTRAFTFNPRLFFYRGERTRFSIGNSTTAQYRDGGDIEVVRGRPTADRRYFENNRTLRNVTTAQFEHELESGTRIIGKQAFSFFDRETEIPDYGFRGRQFNSYTDVSVFVPAGRHTLVFGGGAVYDSFSERSPAVTGARDEVRTTLGGFVQDTFAVNDRLAIEAGLRVDAVRDIGTFALPRVSVLYRFNEHLSSRVTVGFGYKPPTIFTEEAETRLFRGIRRLPDGLEAETSRGGTVDFNYRGSVGEFSYSLNHMFYLTEIRNPLVLVPAANNTWVFANSTGRVRSSGFETNLRASYDIVKLFVGYTFTRAKADYLTGDKTIPLTPESKLNSALLLEKEEDYKVGFESYFTGRQTLSDRSRTDSFWVLGLFAEKIFERFSIFFNAENITDTRQSRFGPVVMPPLSNPTFAEIYTHTEGRIFNGGIKLRF